MATALPQGYEFISELEVETEQLWQLLDDVAGAEDPLVDGVIQGDMESVIDPTADEEDITRTALGIKDTWGNLVGYASATIDGRDNHATVDCMVVHPDNQNESIGKALTDEGISFLGKQGAESISFKPFGQVQFLTPYLITRHGFDYDGLNEEYITRSVSSPTGEQASEEADALPQLASKEPEGRKLNSGEMTDFIDKVNGLIKASADYACINSLDVEFYDMFEFESAGRRYILSKESSPELGCKSWTVTEADTAELVSSPYGIVMVTEKEYTVVRGDSEDAPLVGMYWDSREIRGKDGKMRPFFLKDSPGSSLEPGHIILPRYEQIMKALDKLTPEKLVTKYYL